MGNQRLPISAVRPHSPYLQEHSLYLGILERVINLKLDMDRYFTHILRKLAPLWQKMPILVIQWLALSSGWCGLLGALNAQFTLDPVKLGVWMEISLVCTSGRLGDERSPFAIGLSMDSSFVVQ